VVAASKLIGSSGEHFVMSALLRQGYIAALAPDGAPNVDILVSDINGSRLCSIQVKSRSGKGTDGGWHMRPKHETLVSDRLLYCFVNFSDTGQALENAPEVYILPSNIVAEVLSTSHKIWLRNPGKNGHTRKDNPVRRLLPDYTNVCAPEVTPFNLGWLNKYKNAWILIDELVTQSSESTK
jgi:hypothetical protein